MSVFTEAPNLSVLDAKRKFKLGARFLDQNHVVWAYSRVDQGKGVRFYRWLPNKFIVRLEVEQP